MRVITGGPERIEVLFDRYGDKLFRIAYSILLNQHDAEDVVQEIFARILVKKPEFESEEHEENWLVRVTVNQCKDLMRKNKIRIYTPLEEVTHIGTEENFQKNHLLDTVFSLPEKYREVIILYYYEDYDVEKISGILGLGKSAVKMRLSRGREILKKTVEKEENA